MQQLLSCDRFFGPRVRISVSPHKRKASANALAFASKTNDQAHLSGRKGAKKTNLRRAVRLFACQHRLPKTWQLKRQL